jgi:bifunctional non-homologous end joining protein LigD
MGYDRQGRLLRVARIIEGNLVACGSAGSGLSDADAHQVRAALDAGHAVIVIIIEYGGFTPVGELRHPVIRAWHRG